MMYDLPPVTRAILIANVVICLLMRLIPSVHEFAVVYGSLWPIGTAPLQFAAFGVGFHFWQLITYAFMQYGWAHLAFNMFALWMFGGPIEHLLGAKHYTFFYLFCAVIAGFAHLLIAHFFLHGFIRTAGASGAIVGLLVAFGVMYPRMKMFLLFLPIPMPAWVFVTGYILLELFLGVGGYQSGVAHFAHLGGAVGGFFLLQYWRGKLPIRPKRILTR